MHSEPTRRAFLHATSVAATAALTGTAAANEADPASSADARPADPSKILNYNAKMGYRPLGKTGIMISEIALGGHPGGPEANNEKNRRAVLERAIELGMNYVDNNIAEECALYGRTMGKSLRKHYHIGFASWPQKLTAEYEDQLTVEGMLGEIDNRLRDYQTDTLDIWRPVGATWGDGQLDQATMWEVSRRTLDKVVAVFDKVHRQGKVRFLGISAHKPSVFRRVLNDYPQFSVILFPYMFLTKAFDGDSLLALAAKKNAGVIAIKPFAAGSIFKGGTPTKLEGGVDERAASLLKAMLQEKRISAIIPGVLSPEHLTSNVRASHERDEPLSEKDKQALRECTERFHAHLPAHYQWLCRWKVV